MLFVRDPLSKSLFSTKSSGLLRIPSPRKMIRRRGVDPQRGQSEETADDRERQWFPQSGRRFFRRYGAGLFNRQRFVS
jgi:hypothetical protein